MKRSYYDLTEPQKKMLWNLSRCSQGDVPVGGNIKTADNLVRLGYATNIGRVYKITNKGVLLVHDDHCEVFDSGDAMKPSHPSPEPVNEYYESALRRIVSLHPDPDCCSPLVPKYIGPNDGQASATSLWYALNTARTALGLATYPEPDHWNKGNAA